MSERVSLVIDMTLEERQRIEKLAQESGYESPGEYLLALVEDAEIQEEDIEPTKEELEEEFRQGWQAAKSGQTIPASELWDALNRDD